MPETETPTVVHRKFKYENEIQGHAIPNCPPADSEYYGPAVHFCHQPFDLTLDFQPSAFKIPRRLLQAPIQEKCAHFGISFFISEEKARTEYNRAPWNEKTRDKIGRFFATGTITAGLGVTCDLEIERGHFNLHEYDGVQLEQSFTISGNI